MRGMQKLGLGCSDEEASTGRLHRQRSAAHNAEKATERMRYDYYLRTLALYIPSKHNTTQPGSLRYMWDVQKGEGMSGTTGYLSASRPPLHQNCHQISNLYRYKNTVVIG